MIIDKQSKKFGQTVKWRHMDVEEQNSLLEGLEECTRMFKTIFQMYSVFSKN